MIGLRDVRDDDLDALFEQMRDPESVAMAAFTAEDPDDRAAFDAHMARVRNNPEGTLRAITEDGRLVGTIASFVMEGDTEITRRLHDHGHGDFVRARPPRRDRGNAPGAQAL
jgi:hypothetical protein